MFIFIVDTWETTGIVVAGGHGKGSGYNQLDSSYGIHVDSNHTLFIADYNNNRIVKWEKDQLSGVVYAHGRCESGNINELCSPSAMTSSKDGTLFVAVQNDTYGGIITVKNGLVSKEALITANTSFYGIVLDDSEQYLYLGHHRTHSVVKYRIDGTSVSTVAGKNGRGSRLDQLDYRMKTLSSFITRSHSFFGQF